VVVDDERVIRNFRSFSHADLVKTDLIILMDFSESVRSGLAQETARASDLISEGAWSSEDRISVASFSGTETRFICDGNCGSALSAASLGKGEVTQGGATPLFDALSFASAAFMRRPHSDALPIIVLFSDGQDTISRSSFHEALEKVLESGAQIYAVDISPQGRPSTGTALLQKLAEDSGGRYIRINEGVTAILHDVIDDLQAAKIVTYPLPVSRSDFHSIRILPTHDLKVQFRSRRGYYRDADDTH
jgi:Mg-chelatase subunit ChlD